MCWQEQRCASLERDRIGQFKHEVAPMKTLANVLDIEPSYPMHF